MVAISRTLLSDHVLRTYSEHVFVALGVQCEMCMRHIFLCGMPSFVIFLYIISQTAQFSKKKVINHEKCYLIFSKIFSETFLILRRIVRDMIKMFIGLQSKYPLFLSDFNET